MKEWEDGKITSDLLLVIAFDDPVTYSLHAKENNFLEDTGSQRFKQVTKRENRQLHL